MAAKPKLTERQQGALDDLIAVCESDGVRLRVMRTGELIRAVPLSAMGMKGTYEKLAEKGYVVIFSWKLDGLRYTRMVAPVWES